eukprot:GFUD01108116.1.p1 GENE.GFUD01108116.1~~GFUD01108116.1.p1  ORF type:complete len:237 (+),score=66.17 GFUD01108116.1:151-861(+)
MDRADKKIRLREKLSQACEPSTIAYRSTGSMPVPLRRCSTPSATPMVLHGGKKTSCSILPATMRGPDKNYAIQYKLKLQQAQHQTVKDESETVPAQLLVKTEQFSCKPSIQPSSPCTHQARVTRPIIQGKAQTREADVVREIKRGSMKEKWGLSLVYRMEDSRIELAVNKVSMFSPAAKAGIQTGDTILLINDWKVEAMEQIQAALNIFLAAGFSVNLGWIKTSNCLDEWGALDAI